MTLDEMGNRLETLASHVEARFKNLEERMEFYIEKLDSPTDAVLESAAESRWTPVFVAGALLAAFCLGIWVCSRF